MSVTVEVRKRYTPPVFYAACSDCGWIGPGHLLEHAAEEDAAEHACPPVEPDHPALDALARAQLAQAKRLGYRDAATRYDPKGDS